MQLETRSPPGPLDGRLLCRICVCMCSWRVQAVLVLGRRFGGHSDGVAACVRRRAGVAAGSVGWGIVQEVAIAVALALDRARAPVVPSPDGPPNITCHCHGHASVQLLLGSLVPPACCLCCAADYFPAASGHICLRTQHPHPDILRHSLAACTSDGPGKVLRTQ
jgi:hypothetical protein